MPPDPELVDLIEQAELLYTWIQAIGLNYVE
jgi:hypothetical protein